MNGEIMSEKRFVACDKWADSEGNIFKFVVIDTKKLGDKQFILRCNHWIEAQDICNRLNDTLDELREENERLKSERRNDAKEFSALFKQNLRLKKENDKLKKEIKNDWICGCCKHFHLGIRDRCDKSHNWILKDESCQDFERELGLVE